MLKNNQKGLTLVEVISALVVMIVLMVIATPFVIDYINQGKQQLYDTQIENITLALKMWASDNKSLLPENDGETITLTLMQLKQSDLIPGDISNPIDQTPLPDDMTMTITKVKNNYRYNVNKDSGTKHIWEETPKQAPSIILSGDVLVYVELNNPYIERGVLASTPVGQPIKEYVTKVEGDGVTVQTDKMGTYKITYTVTDPSTGLSSSITRTVIVRDTTPPFLVAPANITISKTVLTYNLMDGVSATDNSGKPVTITISHNLSLGIPGRYAIKYTAKDIYGNYTTLDRIITISS